MSKSKGKSYPAPVSHVAREVKAGGHVLLWLGVAVVALVLIGPSLAAKGTNAAIKAGVQTATETATGVCAEDGLNHACALPANGNRMATPPPTTIPVPKPYGPPNGPVRKLPSEMPPPTMPPADEPVLSGPSGGGPLGELLEQVPEIGPALEGGVQALGPGLKALNP